MRKSATACTMPATGERAPLFTLVTVRAIVPVAAMPPKSGDDEVRDALRHQLLVGVVAVVDEVVGHARAQQRLERAQQRDRDRRREEVLHRRPVEARAARRGQARAAARRSACRWSPPAARRSTPAAPEATSTTIVLGSLAVSRATSPLPCALAARARRTITSSDSRPIVIATQFDGVQVLAAARRSARRSWPASCSTASPRKSRSCESAMITAMPAVKPMMIATGHEAHQRAEAQRAHGEEQHARHHRRDEQVRHPVLLGDGVEQRHEGARRARRSARASRPGRR